MTFKLNNDADVNGTSLKGYVTASYASLVAAFGEPIEGDGYKVSGEWTFEDNDGNVITLYDWKKTDFYDPNYPTVEEFRNQSSAEFNIGGHSGIDVASFQTWLLSQIS